MQLRSNPIKSKRVFSEPHPNLTDVLFSELSADMDVFITYSPVHTVSYIVGFAEQ